MITTVPCSNPSVSSQGARGSVFRASPDHWRAVIDVLPPPERPNATDYCRKLLDTDLFTVNMRRPIRILDASQASVRATTERAPAGEDIPLQDIETAFKLLFERGEVEVAVRPLGMHRTFLGALLASLPHAMPHT